MNCPRLATRLLRPWLCGRGVCTIYYTVAHRKPVPSRPRPRGTAAEAAGPCGRARPPLTSPPRRADLPANGHVPFPRDDAVMTVLLAGATGTLGSALLAQPAASAYRIRAAARRVPSPGRGDVEWQRIDIATGEGVEAAVAGVDVVIHAASAPRGDTARTDVGGTGRLLAAAARAGVRHLLYISIVGVDRIPHAYYRHKVAAEKVVQGGAVPWTILRGTQFHDLMDSWFHGLARFPLAVAPRGWLVQPIHVADFAGEVWRSVAEGPTGRVPDAAGPEVLTWQAMLEAWWR